MALCRDYITLAEAKSVIATGTLSDDAITMLLFGVMDWIDKNIVGHSFNRAVRIYEANSDSTAATVEVTGALVRIIITDGVNAGTYDYALADYDYLFELVDAINAADIGVTATLLGHFATWVSGLPPTDLAVASAQDIKGMTAWKVLCYSKLSLCLNGSGNSILFLPLVPAVVYSVVEDATTLVQGTGFAVDRRGWLERLAGNSANCGVSCWPANDCEKYDVGCWSRYSPCNIQVSFRPACWPAETGMIAAAIKQAMSINISQSGMQSETIGKYSYTLGDNAAAALGMMLTPLEGQGLVLNVEGV